MIATHTPASQKKTGLDTRKTHGHYSSDRHRIVYSLYSLRKKTQTHSLVAHESSHALPSMQEEDKDYQKDTKILSDFYTDEYKRVQKRIKEDMDNLTDDELRELDNIRRLERRKIMPLYDQYLDELEAGKHGVFKGFDPEKEYESEKHKEAAWQTFYHRDNRLFGDIYQSNLQKLRQK